MPPKPNPWVNAPPNVVPPRPPGPVVLIDPREVREKQIDNPRGTATIPDMAREDRLTLTGKVRLLKIGSVGGKAILDASGLEAEEIVITGDLNATAIVKLNAPNGKVTIGGHVTGSANLTVTAAGGDVILSAGSGKFDGGAEATVLAKRLEVKGLLSGSAKLIVTLTEGGSAAIGAVEDKAMVIYK